MNDEPADPRDHKVHTIEGVMRRTDGQTVHFMLDDAGNWHQWGNTTEVLGQTQPIVAAMRNGLFDGGGLADRDG